MMGRSGSRIGSDGCLASHASCGGLLLPKRFGCLVSRMRMLPCYADRRVEFRAQVDAAVAPVVRRGAGRRCSVGTTEDGELSRREQGPAREGLVRGRIGAWRDGRARPDLLHGLEIGGQWAPTGDRMLPARTPEEQRGKRIALEAIRLFQVANPRPVALEVAHVCVWLAGLLPVGAVGRQGLRPREVACEALNVQPWGPLHGVEHPR